MLSLLPTMNIFKCILLFYDVFGVLYDRHFVFSDRASIRPVGMSLISWRGAPRIGPTPSNPTRDKQSDLYMIKEDLI